MVLNNVEYTTLEMFVTHRSVYQDEAGLNISKKSNKKKKVKFAILLDGLFICLFQYSY